jgi:hypothetical protein
MRIERETQGRSRVRNCRWLSLALPLVALIGCQASPGEQEHLSATSQALWGQAVGSDVSDINSNVVVEIDDHVCTGTLISPNTTAGC